MTTSASQGESHDDRRSPNSGSVTLPHAMTRGNSEMRSYEFGGDEDEDELAGVKRVLLDNSTFDDNNIRDPEVELGMEVAGGSGSLPRVRRKYRQSNIEFVKEMLAVTLPTLVLSTIGLTITGMMVEVVANWKAMSRIDELFILVPVLNNMKGNLEMNLSTRLGTAAYLGSLDFSSTRQPIIIGNILLLQVQALLISALAGCFSFVLSWISNAVEGKNRKGKTETIVRRAISSLRDQIQKGESWMGDKEMKSKGIWKKKKKKLLGNSGFSEFAFVVCTSMSAASLSALTLGSFVCTLILICRRYGINPDNVAPPIASALGDLVTLTFLSVLSALFLPFLPTRFPSFFTLVLLATAVILTFFASRNAHVRPLLKQGWTPLVAAMLITSFSGLVLDQFVTRYEGYGLLAIVITGLPGGVGSIFISRISTLLHAISSSSRLKKLSTATENVEQYTALYSQNDSDVLGEAPASQGGRQSFEDSEPSSPISQRTNLSLSPTDTLIEDDSKYNVDLEDARLSLFAGTLFTIAFPIQILFLLFIHFSGWIDFTWTFVVVFVIMFSFAVMTSLILANWLTHFLWSKGLDPDLYAMPIQSSIVDLIGQCSLVLTYELATFFGNGMTTRDLR